MYYPDVPALDPEDIELLCNEYVAHNKHLDPHIADRLGVKRGLRNPDGTGVLAGITNVSSVIGYEKLPEGTIRPIPAAWFTAALILTLWPPKRQERPLHV